MCWILGIWSGMSFTLWEKNIGRDPNNIRNSPPNISLEPFSTYTKHSTCRPLRYSAILTDYVSNLPKNSSTFANFAALTLSSIWTSDPLSTLYLITNTNWISPLFSMYQNILKVASCLLILKFIDPFSISTKARPIEGMISQ